MEKVFVRSPYNYDRRAAALEAQLICRDKSLAKQEFKEEVDINTIVDRFGIGYEMPEGVRMPTYGDFTGVADYHSAANAIAQANEAFDALPAQVRVRFANDPGAFVAFCSDDKNRDEAVKLGLVPPPMAPKAATEAVAAPTAPVATPPATPPG